MNKKKNTKGIAYRARLFMEKNLSMRAGQIKREGSKQPKTAFRSSSAPAFFTPA